MRGLRFASRPIIGDSATLANATPALLERFYQDWYRPDLMCLIAVGDIDSALVRKTKSRKNLAVFLRKGIRQHG